MLLSGILSWAGLAYGATDLDKQLSKSIDQIKLDVGRTNFISILYPEKSRMTFHEVATEAAEETQTLEELLVKFFTEHMDYSYLQAF